MKPINCKQPVWRIVLYSGNTCLVEWPEGAMRFSADDTLHLYVTALNTQSRNL